MSNPGDIDPIFVKDLNEGADAWYDYADAMFGKQEWVRRPDGYREMRCVNGPEADAARLAAGKAFHDAFLIARGWRLKPGSTFEWLGKDDPSE